MSSTPYTVEEFTPEESTVLERYFTNLHLPVFGVWNLEEEVKGALFARYSRTSKSLRRLFLDEFYDEHTIGPVPAHVVGTKRATELHDRVFIGFGDDSVAQLCSVHLACEQASNLLTKILERGRLASYLEQSTRYISFGSRVDGHYRYYRDPEILNHQVLGPRYTQVMNTIFGHYGVLQDQLLVAAMDIYPRNPEVDMAAHRRAMMAKVFDNLRGILPAATISNLGIHGSAQAFGSLLLNMNSLQLPEASEYSEMMFRELQKIIPSFVKTIHTADRGSLHSSYLEDARRAVQAAADNLLADLTDPSPASEVTLLDFDPNAEDKLIAAILAEQTHFGEEQLRQRVAVMAPWERTLVLEAYFGNRYNRRHRPGRSLELVNYRFEVVSDYGAFRDLQRHRMLTITWQPLTPDHGYEIPPLVGLSGQEPVFHDLMELQAGLYQDLAAEFPWTGQAQYALGFAYKLRYTINVNARELTHMLELRTGPDGHDDYRRVCQQMHDLIRGAGHTAIADMMKYVNHQTYDLGRLAAEEREEAKRAARA